ncbi:cobalamin-dependent protein, partial [Candidatus Woesearchaeota archaeon]|nr:cobalamin-dependent protein [Candidatus Woesearchaeota archaeon]
MSRKPSVAFAEPKSPFFNVYTAFSQPLLGPVYMATQLSQKGYDAVVFHENIRKLRASDLRRRDVLVISPLTSTAPRGYELAQEYKAVNPKGRVVMGGVHVSAIPYEAAAFDFVDNVGIGEGDLIIEGLVNGDYREKIVRGKPVEDLDDLPFPDFSLVEGLKLRVTGIETSRGCPHGCPYCYVTPMYGTKVRWKSVPRVIEEIRREQAG